MIALTSTTPSQSVAVSSWRGYLRRGGLAIVLCVLLGLVGGVLYTAAAPKKYTATTRVLVTATGVENLAQASNSRTPNATINLDTEAQLVTSASVVQAATELYPPLTSLTYPQIVDNISVSVPPNTTVLQISYTSSTPKSAQAGANALGTAYLNDRQSTAQSALTRQIKNAQGNVTALTDKLQTLSRQSTSLAGGSSGKNFVIAQIGLVKNQINSVNAQLVAMNNIQVTPGRVVTAAGRPASPSSPKLLLDVVSGFALGLLLGLFVAWLRVRFRRHVRTADDLNHVVDANCLAVLPAGVGAKREAGTFRRIALVATSAVPHLPARLLVSSPLLSSSAGHVAAGVAASLAHGGTSVALLQVHGPDLETPLPSNITGERVTHADDLVAGGSESLVEAIDRCRGENSILVIDAPGATLTPDAQTIAAHADAVLLVVDAGSSTADVRAALEEFDTVGAPVLGTVLVTGPATIVEPDEDADNPLRQPWVEPATTPAGSRKRRRPAADAQHAAEPDSATTESKRGRRATDRARGGDTARTAKERIDSAVTRSR